MKKYLEDPGCNCLWLDGLLWSVSLNESGRWYAWLLSLSHKTFNETISSNPVTFMVTSHCLMKLIKKVLTQDICKCSHNHTDTHTCVETITLLKQTGGGGTYRLSAWICLFIGHNQRPLLMRSNCFNVNRVRCTRSGIDWGMSLAYRSVWPQGLISVNVASIADYTTGCILSPQSLFLNYVCYFQCFLQL